MFKYEIGDIVYATNDSQRLPRIVTAILQRGNGFVEFECTHINEDGNRCSNWLTIEEIN